MTGRRRRELTDSFRLVAGDEQWFPRDLFVGLVAAVVWVAGTGALATQIASALDVPLGLASGETPSTIAIAIFGLLWLVVPVIAVVIRLRHRLLNLRGNVEQYYRLDHPAALLAPPALLVVTVCALAVAFGSFSRTFTLVMIPVGLFFLVRTLAFSYRVYSFSHPLVVQLLVAFSTVVLIGSAFVGIGTARDRSSLVDQVLLTAGLPAWITGSVVVEGVTVSGVAAAALLPVILAAAYVLVQTVVALGVRLLEPDVDRSKMRTGQRYPPFLPAATPVEPPARPGNGADKPADADVAAGTANASASGAATEAGAVEATDEPADDEEDLDDVSNTRVFTPPAGDGDEDFDAGETHPVLGAGGGEDASTADVREHCDACGESFRVDTAVRFCPNCGAALGGE